jgi:hypothetical protein
MCVIENKSRARSAIALAAVVLVALLAERAEAAKTYYIEESTDYTGNGCQDDNVNTLSASLRTGLDNAGWSGQRWVNADAWPQDFQEACSSDYEPGGLDLHVARGRSRR